MIFASLIYIYVRLDQDWGQQIIFIYYADKISIYLIGFHLDKKDVESKIDHAKTLVDKAHKVGVRQHIHLFDSWHCSQEIIESSGKDGESVLKRDRQVEYGDEMIYIDKLLSRINMTKRGEP
jgi:hypothetical protein